MGDRLLVSPILIPLQVNKLISEPLLSGTGRGTEP